MFSRSAMVFAAMAAVELPVVALAVDQVDVLLLLVVVAAVSAFGSVHLFERMAGMMHQSTEGAMPQDPRGNNALGEQAFGAVLRIAGPAVVAFPGLANKRNPDGPSHINSSAGAALTSA